MAEYAATPVPEAERRIKGYWDELIRHAKKARSSFDEGLERVRRQYLGDFSDEFLEAGGAADAEGGTPQDTTAFSLVFSTSKTITPYLYFKDPSVRAQSRSNPGLARAIELFAEYLHQEQPFKRVAKSTIRFADLYGCGCTVSEWDAVRGLPTRRRVRMQNILVNPDATEDMRTVSWVAERFLEPIRRVRADKTLRYRDEIKPSMELSPWERTTEKREKDLGDLRDIAGGWRIWIRNESPGLVYAKDPADEAAEPIPSIGEVTNRVLTIFDGSPRIHRDTPWPYVFDHDEFPHTFLRFNEQEGSFWGFSDYFITKGLQKFINWAWTWILRRARKSCTDKILHDAGLSPEVVEKIASGEDLAMIPVSRENMDAIERSIHILKFDKVEPEMLALLARCKEVYDEIMGVTGYMRGGLPASGSRSATQAEIEDERAQNRINDRLDAVEEFLTSQNRKDVQIAAQLVPTFDTFDVEQDVALGPDALTGQLTLVDVETAPERATVRIAKGEKIDERSPAFAVLGALGALKLDQRGMVYFIGPEYGRVWRDDMSVEEIRREVSVYVEHGTTRKLNKSQTIEERSKQMLTLVPVFQGLGMHARVASLVNNYLEAFEDEKSQALRIGEEEIASLGPALTQALAANQNAKADGEVAANGQGQMQRLLAAQLGERV